MRIRGRLINSLSESRRREFATPALISEPSPMAASHQDYELLAPLMQVILEQVGGWSSFAEKMPALIRKAIDEVIDTPRTKRFTLSETEKTEKTYLGTKIEILFRAYLMLPKGRNLDLSLRGAEVDIKNTMGSNWTIPIEAVGHPCILIRENEQSALCSVGIIIANDAYLNGGRNRDGKRTFTAEAIREHVWWLLRSYPYPGNLWERMPLIQRETIMAAGGGAQRVAALFKAMQGIPINRSTIEAICQQDDYMKRIRRNGGARDLLAPLGIAILWGQKHRDLIARLSLGEVASDEFISFSPRNGAQRDLLRLAGEID